MTIDKIGKILDPIHGAIGITKIEKFIIDQKIFGRLRKVKQNTLLNYVFPGANHTRFEHSIGVMHLAEIIFNKVNENVVIAKEKGRKYNENKEYISLKELLSENDFNARLQELRIAALLHDVGHGPTSHKFDDFTINGEGLIKILEQEEIFSEYKNYMENYLKGKEQEKIEHELVSCIFIIKILKAWKIKNEECVQCICIKNILKMIEPNLLPKHKIEIEGKDFSDFFNSIIAGFPFDADRMDYIYRDSFYSGVKYGFYDQSRILMSLLPVEHEEGKVTLGIKESGLDSIIRIIQSRNHLYNQVYFHKTNCATNSMLDFIFKYFKDNKKSVLDDIKSYEEFEEFYCKNGDEYFFNHTLNKLLSERNKEATVLQDLHDRKLWKKCYEDKIFVDSKEEFDKKKFDEKGLKSLKENLEKDIYIQENYSKNEGLKGIDKSKSLFIKKDKNNKYITQKWDEVTHPEFKNLKKLNTFIKRVYINDDIKKDDIRTKLQELESNCLCKIIKKLLRGILKTLFYRKK